MVVLSAAIKGVSGEIIEAARLDGASERQVFLRVIVPVIRGSIITVSTTIAIVTIKILDSVYVTTGGRFNDDVVANRMFHEIFQFFDDGRGAALATLLFVAVLPVMYINLLIVTLPSTVIPITIAAFAAYAFAWVPFRGRGILFTIVVGLLVVPIQMSLIPILQIYSAGNLYGSFLGIWLAHTGFGLPLAIFLLYNFISQLPRDLFESAAIDGASHLQVFMQLVLPLSVPALGAIAIFQFLWVWNDLLVALVFLGPGAEVRVLPTALFQLIGSRGGSWHLLTAGAFITMVVPLVVFLLLQRAFVRGILAGSVKP